MEASSYGDKFNIIIYISGFVAKQVFLKQGRDLDPSEKPRNE
jgi:hypothetical protein